jgi:hypothetical protein
MMTQDPMGGPYMGSRMARHGIAGVRRHQRHGCVQGRRFMIYYKSRVQLGKNPRKQSNNLRTEFSDQELCVMP